MKEVREHMPILRGEGHVPDRPSYVMRAKDSRIFAILSGNLPGPLNMPTTTR